MTSLFLAPWFLPASTTPRGPRWATIAKLFALAVHVWVVWVLLHAAARYTERDPVHVVAFMNGVPTTVAT